MQKIKFYRNHYSSFSNLYWNIAICNL
jgi:hypothetical protein